MDMLDKLENDAWQDIALDSLDKLFTNKFSAAFLSSLFHHNLVHGNIFSVKKF